MRLEVRDATEHDAAEVAGTIGAAFGAHDVGALWRDVEADGLVRASLRVAGRARTSGRDLGGVPMLVLEGWPLFYGVRGFERAADHRLYPPSARTPDRAFQVVLLEAYEEWMTGQCVYRDVWWRHDSAGLRGERLTGLEERLGVSDPRPR